MGFTGGLFPLGSCFTYPYLPPRRSPPSPSPPPPPPPRRRPPPPPPPTPPPPPPSPPPPGTRPTRAWPCVPGGCSRRAPPGDPHRVFVVEQAGRILEVRDAVKQDTPFLDITSLVRSGGEQGLLSMAFAPDYATSGRYYVDYTAPRPGDSSGSILTVDEISPAGRRNVFTVQHPSAGNHNAGQLQFGPDGLLYATTGDGGSTPMAAQDLGSLLGKVLRVNPLSGSAPEIYAYGVRNPFRFSFDRQT